MKKLILSGFVTGIVFLIVCILGLIATIWFLLKLAIEYHFPNWNTQSAQTSLTFLVLELL